MEAELKSLKRLARDSHGSKPQAEASSDQSKSHHGERIHQQSHSSSAGYSHSLRVNSMRSGRIRSSRRSAHANPKYAKAAENLELLKEASKSKKDIFTGRYHCMSCGKGFASLQPLADHLTKHNGINSEDFKVIQYRQQHREGKSAPRACKTGFLLADLLDAATLKSKKKNETAGEPVRVSTMADRRECNPKPRVKVDDKKPEKMDKAEREMLQSAFKGLRLKNAKRVRKKDTSAIKRQVLVERVVAARELLSQIDAELTEHSNQLTELPEDAARPLVLHLESKVAALRNTRMRVNLQLETSVEAMRKKLTAQQHIRSLLAVSLRQTNNSGYLEESDLVDYDASFTHDELDAFDALEDLCGDSEGDAVDDQPENAENEPEAVEIESSYEVVEPSLQPRKINELWRHEIGSEQSDSDTDTDGSNDILRAWALTGSSAIQFAQIIASKQASTQEVDAQHEFIQDDHYKHESQEDTCIPESTIKILRRQDVSGSGGPQVVPSSMGSSMLQPEHDRSAVPYQAESNTSVVSERRNLLYRQESDYLQASTSSEYHQSDAQQIPHDQDEQLGGKSRAARRVSAQKVKEASEEEPSGAIREDKSLAILAEDPPAFRAPPSGATVNDYLCGTKQQTMGKCRTKKTKSKEDDEPQRDFTCSVCNRICNSSMDFEEHMKSKGHRQKSMQMELKSLNSGTTASSKPMMGKSTSDVDRAVTSLLVRLNEMQHASMVKHKDDKSKIHKWMLNGTREVSRAISRGRIKALIIAPDVEVPVSDVLSDLIQLAKSNNIFTIFALTRRKLGGIYNVRKKMSLIGVIDLDGVNSLYRDLIDAVEKNPVVQL